MSVHAARSRVTQAREHLSSNRLDLVESALRTAEQYLAGLTDDEATSVRAEIAAVRAELANQPTDEETRCVAAARGKVRSARNRLEERQLMGIEDVLGAAVKYLEPVRPQHRASLDAEIAAIQAEVTAALQPPPTVAPPAPAPAPAPVAPPPVVVAPSVAVAPPIVPAGPSEQEQRQISAARGKIRAARSRVEDHQLLGIEEVVAAASAYLASVRPEYRRDVDAEIAAVTAEIAAAQRAATAAPPPSPAVPAGPSEDEQRSIAAARSKIRAARTLIADDELAGIDDVVAAAVAYLANVRHAYRASVDDELAILRSEIETARTPAVAPPTEEEQRYISAARGKIRAARARLDDQQLLGIEEVVAAAINYLITVRGEHRAAVDAEITALNADIAAARRAATRAASPAVVTSSVVTPMGPSDEEQRNLTAARGKIRAARSRLEEQQLLGIEDVLAAAASYVATVRPEHRTAVDAELAALNAEVATVRARTTPMATPARYVAAQVASGPTEEEQRQISAARGKIRAARSRIAEQQLLGIDDVINAAVNYLGPVRAEHRAPIDAEIAALRAELHPAAAPAPTPAVTPAGPEPSQRVVPDTSGSITPTQDELRAMASARSMMRLARRKLEDQQLPGMEEIFGASVKHLESVRPAQRAAVDAELATLRADILAAPGGAAALGAHAAAPAVAPPAPVPPPTAPAPAPVAPPPVATRPLTDDEQSCVSRARGRVSAARSALEGRRFDAVQPAIDEALALLAKVPEFGTRTLRGELDDIKAQLLDETRRDVRRKLLEEVERHLRNAENDADYKHFESGEESVRRALDRLAKPDAREILTADQIATYEHRASVLRGLFASTLRADALARVKPLIEELESEVADDVYRGMDGHELVRKERELGYMRMRVLGAIRYVPGNDPDVAAIVHRVVATDRKIAASATNWSKLRREARVANDWNAILSETAGWDQEAPAPDADIARMVEPQLPKTRQVLHRTRLLMEDGQRRNIAVPPDAAALFNAAATKLAAAYIRVLDAAERMPTPFNTFLIRRPAQLAYNIELALAGTPHRDALVARAQHLDGRWRAEVAALSKTQQELHEKLTREAEAKWPELRDSTPAVPFDPDLLHPGRLVFLEGVFNRAGWDYTGPGVEFAVQLGPQFVSGVCAAHVDAALLRAWTEHKLDVGDRVPWNVIGVVEGPGTLGVRTQLTVRDQMTNLVLGEAEAWSTQPCLRIQIIGLQAGPVIVLGEAAALTAPTAEHVDELNSNAT